MILEKHAFFWIMKFQNKNQNSKKKIITKKTLNKCKSKEIEISINHITEEKQEYEKSIIKCKSLDNINYNKNIKYILNEINNNKRRSTILPFNRIKITSSKNNNVISK